MGMSVSRLLYENLKNLPVLILEIQVLFRLQESLGIGGLEDC